MTVRYAVTWEYATRAPETHRGTITAGQPHTCMAGAVKAAKKALRPREWTSVVCVLLERLDYEAGGEVVEMRPVETQ